MCCDPKMWYSTAKGYVINARFHIAFVKFFTVIVKVWG